MVSFGVVYAVLDDICYHTRARNSSLGMLAVGSHGHLAPLTSTWLQAPESSGCCTICMN